MSDVNEKNQTNCDNKCDACDVENCEGRSAIRKLETNSLNHIKKIIGVISGKGGVGKSYVTSLLASSLNKKGYKVGILDGDICGPSIPKAFGVHGALEGDGHSLIFPYETESGIKMVSSNLLLSKETEPIIWRGTLISSLLSQFYADVLWGDLDYLFIDMPPGTGDISLTSFQSLPLDGVIIVTTPQDLVSLIVEKQINMAKMMNINILGIVENMSYVSCPKCDEKIYLFGESKLEEIAKEYDLNILGRLPLISSNAEKVDNGGAEMINLPEIEEVVEKIK